MSENDAHSPEEEFQGDVVDLLKGTEDNELKEIQDLLEKSDNNEAVGDEIEALLRRRGVKTPQLPLARIILTEQRERCLPNKRKLWKRNV